MTDPAAAHVAWLRRPVPQHTGGWTWSVADAPDLGRARASLRQHLLDVGHVGPDAGERELDEAGERIVLAADEMASNGVRHGALPVVVSLTRQLATGCYLLTVTDHRPGAGPRPDPARDPALGGLGLTIIARFAMDHGWWAGSRAKTIWAELPTG